MSVQAVTHINFNGQARAALSFYHAVFGGQIMLVTYQDFGVENAGGRDHLGAGGGREWDAHHGV